MNKGNLETAIAYFEALEVESEAFNPERHNEFNDLVLNAARAHLQSVNGWQPIETSPKDGADVLLWWPYWSKSPEVGAFIDDEWSSSCDLGGSEEGPTHWQPLPQPPSKDE